MMKIGGEVFPAFNPYDKPTYEIHISGCNKRCKDCHNELLQDFEYGEELDLTKFLNKLKERIKFYEAICIMGGDLLSQDDTEAQELIIQLKVAFPQKELWLFTGEELQDVPDWVKKYFDYIKIGCYKKELAQEGFPASSNQKLLTKGKNY